MSLPWGNFLNQRDVRETNITRIGDNVRIKQNGTVGAGAITSVSIDHNLGVKPVYVLTGLSTDGADTSGNVEVTYNDATSTSTSAKFRVTNTQGNSIEFVIFALLFS